MTSFTAVIGVVSSWDKSLFEFSPRCVDLQCPRADRWVILNWTPVLIFTCFWGECGHGGSLGLVYDFVKDLVSVLGNLRSLLVSALP